MKKEKPIKRFRTNCCSIEWFQNPDGTGIRLTMRDCTGIRDHFPRCRALAVFVWKTFKELAPPSGERAPVTQLVMDELTLGDVDCPINNPVRLLAILNLIAAAQEACWAKREFHANALLKESLDLAAKIKLSTNKVELCWVIERTPIQIMRILKQLPVPAAPKKTKEELLVDTLKADPHLGLWLSSLATLDYENFLTLIINPAMGLKLLGRIPSEDKDGYGMMLKKALKIAGAL